MKLRTTVLLWCLMASSLGCDEASRSSAEADTLEADTLGDAAANDALAEEDPLVSPVVQLVLTVHLEGWRTSDQATFERYAALLRERAGLFERHGARLTLESKELTTGAIRWSDDILSELRDRGHDVAIHADVGGNPALPYSTEAMTADLVAKRAELGQLGLRARHVSGICAPQDWVSAVVDSGFEAVTGLVAYCLMSLPESERPSGYEHCANAAACHASWPPDTADKLHPYRVESASTWTTPADDDEGRLTVVPIFGGIHCLAEEAEDPNAQGCELDLADVDAFEAIMASATSLASPDRVNVVGLNWSFGDSFELEDLERLLVAADAWVARGEARWSTISEVLDLYNLERGATPDPGPDPAPPTPTTLTPGSPATFRIASTTAPESGLLVSVTLPTTPRYEDGAPVALILPGGQTTSGLEDTSGSMHQAGFIELRMAFPGDASAPERVFDNRGRQTLTAVADVVAWAASTGEVLDSDGLTLTEHLPPSHALAGLFGLVGLSNGGNLTLTTLALAERDLPIDFVVNWESPVGDGMVSVEAGGVSAPNRAYDPDTGTWDLSALAWSDTLEVGAGPDTPAPFRGGLFFDFDGDGEVDRSGPDPDFVLRPLVGYETGAVTTRAWWSIRVLTEAERRGLIPSNRPVHVPTLSESTAFWQIRDASHQFAAVADRYPELLFTVVASVVDHVQGQVDHPHVLAQYEGLRAVGIWSRLGCDRAYLAATGVQGAAQASAPDNDAGIALDHQSIRTRLDPETVPIGPALRAAASELVDRARAELRSANLDAPLR